MKFNVPSKSLLGFTSAVSKVISSKTSLPILNNFLFALEGDMLIVKASDMENALVGRLPVTEAEGSGKFCLDAKRLVDLLKEMPDQGITFEIDEYNYEVKITYPNGKFNTVAINGVEYPSAEGEKEEPLLEFTLPVEVALKGIENTLFAVGSDDLRPQMKGILWDVKPEKVIFVSTDTRKLVRYTNQKVAPGVEGSFILPQKPATVFKNVFSDEKEVKIEVTAKSLRFTSDRFTFDCRLIIGSFPDYNKVIRENPYALTVDRLGFINAIKRVGAFGNEGNGLMRFILSQDHMIMRASDSGFGSSGEEKVPCTYTGSDLTIGFSALYLLEIFTTITTREIVMYLADPGRPALCVPAENDPDSDMLVLLMPMNIN